MNVFLVALRTGGHRPAPDTAQALTEVRKALPYDQLSQVASWASVDGNVRLAHFANPREQVGGVVYTSTSPEDFATFSGRPFLMAGAGSDTRQVLDPRFLATTRDAEHLDGRFVVCGYRRTSSGGVLRFFADALGGSSLYETDMPGWHLVSNAPAALTALTGDTALDPLSAASYFGMGISLEGNPLRGSARRVPPGVAHELHTDGRRTATVLFDHSEVRHYSGAGFDPAEAARALSHTVQSLADWPGRGSEVTLTGGRDSRMVFAASVALGLQADYKTLAMPALVGYPLTEDVRVATAVAQRSGVPHRVELAAGELGPMSDPVQAAQIVNALSPGTVSLQDTSGLILTGVSGPLPLVHTGQGGELGRNAYRFPTDIDERELVERVIRRQLPRYPAPLINKAARHAIEQNLHAWAKSRLEQGFTRPQLLDLIFLEKRMATWAGNVMVVHEPNGEATAPLWTRSMLRHELGLPTAERAKEHFVLAMLTELAPELVTAPFQGGNPAWEILGTPDGGLSPRAARTLRVAKRAKRELLDRRVSLLRSNASRSAADVQFRELQRLVREAVHGRSSDPAWEFLNRRSVLHVLRVNPATIDARSRNYVLRLAPYFLQE